MLIEELDFSETNGVGFRDQLSRFSTTIMIMVWSGWRCREKCQLMRKIVEGLSKDPNYLNCITFWLLNADENGIACQEISVIDTPCLLIFQNGKETARFREATSKEAIEHQLEIILDRARNHMTMGAGSEAEPQSPFNF